MLDLHALQQATACQQHAWTCTIAVDVGSAQHWGCHLIWHNSDSNALPEAGGLHAPADLVVC